MVKSCGFETADSMALNVTKVAAMELLNVVAAVPTVTSFDANAIIETSDESFEIEM
jgi:hypothetical protein